jgi:hypothetical protein
MSNTDETISMRPPCPVCCAPPADDREPGPSHHRGSCSRCGRSVAVNTRVNASILDAGIEPVPVCASCWSRADQAIVLEYRYIIR